MLEHLRQRLASYKFGVVLNLLITPLVRSCNVQDSESKKEVIFFIKTYFNKAFKYSYLSHSKNDLLGPDLQVENC